MIYLIIRNYLVSRILYLIFSIDTELKCTKEIKPTDTNGMVQLVAKKYLPEIIGLISAGMSQTASRLL
ncbi:hypothetical protein D3C72_2490540 [compost metagenome]